MDLQGTFHFQTTIGKYKINIYKSEFKKKFFKAAGK
jgi:hypothetical protein